MEALQKAALRDADKKAGRDADKKGGETALDLKRQQDQGVHTGGLLPLSRKKGGPSLTKKRGPLKDRKVARRKAWLKSGLDKASR